jgi:hypothetical protein
MYFKSGAAIERDHNKTALSFVALHNIDSKRVRLHPGLWSQTMLLRLSAMKGISTRQSDSILLRHARNSFLQIDRQRLLTTLLTRIELP